MDNDKAVFLFLLAVVMLTLGVGYLIIREALVLLH